MTEIKNLVGAQRDYFNTGVTQDVKWRIGRLKKLRETILTHSAELTEAMGIDLGRCDAEGFLCDIGPTVMEIDEYIHGLKKWARPERHFSGLHCFPSTRTYVYKKPYGVCLIISPFNFPVILSLGVLAACIAGGNTAVVKVSSKSAETSAVLERIVNEAFNEEYIKVLGGGHDVADECLSQRFDKIFYTGSPKVGKHVLECAAKNLTPVALELGGETGNWAIVRKDANLRDAARKIAFFKILNAGQICININQVAVEETVADEFVGYLKEEFKRQIGEEPLNSPEYPHLITEGAYRKCETLVEKYRENVVYGGKGKPETLRFEPTVIYPVNISDELVMNELFCPILPVVTYKDYYIDSLIETIEQREHGLAFYVFTKNRRWAKHAMKTMQFGGGCINEVVMHIMVKGVPFNGVGHSGMGAYHGKWGFDEFTHPSTVLVGKTHFNLDMREHPYLGEKGKKKVKLFKRFFRTGL